MLLETLLNFLTAAALAALIGAEREMVQISHKDTQEKKLFGGIRTHILISFLGGILTYMSLQFEAYWLMAVGFVILAVFLIINYIHNLFEKHHQGFTTEMTGLITYLLGVLCLSGYANLAAILGIIATITLVSKKYLAQTLEKVERQELYNTLKFAVILFVILPVLPNTPIDPWGLIIPQKIWQVVVLISGVSYIGYILSRLIGTSKGIAITGLLGGLASSTATTSSMAEQSKKNQHIIYPFVIATIAASAMMFFRVLFLVYSFNQTLLTTLIIPMSVMGIVGGFFVGYFLLKTNTGKGTNGTESPSLESPFRILPALKFAGFFLLVSIFASIGQAFFGDEGIYLVSLISGLADVDAISITLASQALDGTISPSIATRGLIIAIITNTIVKLILAKVFGGKEFGNLVMISFIVTLLAGGVSLFFI